MSSRSSREQTYTYTLTIVYSCSELLSSNSPRLQLLCSKVRHVATHLERQKTVRLGLGPAYLVSYIELAAAVPRLASPHKDAC